jgi:hypothetical protein
MKLLNPNCSTTISKIPVTDDEKKWVIEKIKELKLDKETAECFISKSEKKKKVEESKWMNEEHDATWTGFNTMDALLKVKRKYIRVGARKLTPLAKRKQELETQRILTSTFINRASDEADKSWDELFKHMNKYFKLKKELKKMEVDENGARDSRMDRCDRSDK